MRARTLTATIGAAALVATLGAAPASAATYHQPKGKAYAQYIVSQGNKATVFGEYQCWGGKGVLWASIKQGRGDLTAEGSSSIARSWYDVHIPLTCNGKKHVVRAVLAKQRPNPGHPHAYKNLRDGLAYVQWCITDPHFDPSSGSLSGLSSTTKWLRVFAS